MEMQGSTFHIQLYFKHHEGDTAHSQSYRDQDSVPLIGNTHSMRQVCIWK